MTILAFVTSVNRTTDIISLVVVVVGFMLGIITVLYLYHKHNKEIEMEIFAVEFLNIGGGKRERLLNEYIKRDDKYMRVAAGVFLNHYDKISPEIRENLLKYILKKNIRTIENPERSIEEERCGEVERLFGNLSLFVLDRYFDIIPQPLRNEIITQSLLIEEGKGKEKIAEIFATNFEKYDENFRNDVLLKLIGSLNEEVKFQITKILDKNFSVIPQEISGEALQQLMESNRKDNKDYAMNILFKNFYKIDTFIRGGLLTKYARYGADKEILEKFLSTFHESISPDIKKRMMELVNRTK